MIFFSFLILYILVGFLGACFAKIALIFRENRSFSNLDVSFKNVLVNDTNLHSININEFITNTCSSSNNFINSFILDFNFKLEGSNFLFYSSCYEQYLKHNDFDIFIILVSI